MEEELSNRLVKVAIEGNFPPLRPAELLNVTIASLEALRAHLKEHHPCDYQDVEELDAAINVVARNR